MIGLSFTAIVITAVLAALGAGAVSTQDKYTLQVPDGLAFSDFRGYEDWQTVAVSHTESEKVLRAILANPVMMKAYKEAFQTMASLSPTARRWRRSCGHRKKSRMTLGPRTPRTR